MHVSRDYLPAGKRRDYYTPVQLIVNLHLVLSIYLVLSMHLVVSIHLVIKECKRN